MLLALLGLVLGSAPNAATIVASAPAGVVVASVDVGIDAVVTSDGDAPVTAGVLSLGIDGEAVRLGADSLRACLPVIRRIHPTAGIGIG